MSVSMIHYDFLAVATSVESEHPITSCVGIEKQFETFRTKFKSNLNTFTRKSIPTVGSRSALNFSSVNLKHIWWFLLLVKSGTISL